MHKNGAKWSLARLKKDETLRTNPQYYPTISISRGDSLSRGKFRRGSVDLYFERLSFGIAGGVGDGERVRRGLRRSDIDAAGVGGPNGIGLGFEFDGFGVGHAVAELHGLAAANLGGDGIKTLDDELFAAHSFERLAIVLTLFLRFFFFSTTLDRAVFLPAREKNPHHSESGDNQHAPGVKKGIFEGGFGGRIGVRQHRVLLP